MAANPNPLEYRQHKYRHQHQYQVQGKDHQPTITQLQWLLCLLLYEFCWTFHGWQNGQRFSMLLKRLFRQVRGSSFCRSCQSHQGTKIVLRELLLASDCEQTLSIGNINTLLMARQKMKDITSCGRSNIRYTRHITCS